MSLARSFRRIALASLPLGLLAACASAPPPAPTPVAECRAWFDAMDEEVRAAGVADPVAARIDGFPYLRVDRLLASFGREPLNQEEFAAWVERLGRLDQQARRAELANLPAPARARLAARTPHRNDAVDWLLGHAARCRDRLAAEDLSSPADRLALREAARVPDDYLGWQRALGLYPLTSVAFKAGIAAWHDDVAAVYAKPLEALPVRGRLLAYRPHPERTLSTPEVAAILARSRDAALGIPEPRFDDERALLEAFAPVWIVDTQTDDDRIGDPVVQRGRPWPEIDTRIPVVYAYVSHTRFDGDTLLQLNYVAWFPARPRVGEGDLLGGPIDGITWRVTLAADGTVLVADTMHNCGCYHLFYPSARLAPRDRGGEWVETAFAPQRLPPLGAGERYALRVESVTHYVQRVAIAADGPGVAYKLDDYDRLRAIPLAGGGHRGLFRADGIVPGSERGERVLFWPMGVPEPGAMRARGRHATAFVGRRHFDDPFVFERAFAPAR